MSVHFAEGDESISPAPTKPWCPQEWFEGSRCRPAREDVEVVEAVARRGVVAVRGWR